MNPKTESTVERREFAIGFLPVLCLLTVLVLGAMVSDQRSTKSSSRYALSPDIALGLTVFPWTVAGGQTLSNSLVAFGGKDPDYLSPSVRQSVLGGLLLGFIVCPTVYLFGWRDRRLRKQSSIREHALNVSGLMYAACAVITFAIIVVIIPIGLIQENMYASLRKFQSVQANREALGHTILVIVVDLKQYRILPKSMGGGEGSCIGYTLPSDLARSQDGVFSTTVDQNGATIVGRSLLSPSSSITLKLSPPVLASVYTVSPDKTALGLWNWSYEGEFR